MGPIRLRDLRAAGLACALIAAGGCTTLLGVDGDYGLDPTGAGSSGAGTGGAGPASGSTGEAASTGEGGSGVTSSSGSQGSAGGGGDGGEGGGGGSGGSGAGGGLVDCQLVFCGQEVPGGDLPASARNPRLTKVGSEVRLVTLVGDVGLVWAGRTACGPVAGDFLGGNVAAEDAVPVGLDEVAILAGGDVTLGVESLLAGVSGPHGVTRTDGMDDWIDGVVAGVDLDPPLYATRQGASGESTFHYVTGSGPSSVAFACPEKTGRCTTTGGECTVSDGAPAHALSQQGAFVLLGRVCGAMRTAVVHRNGAPVMLPRRDGVESIAVASGVPEPFVLTIAAEGAGRVLRIDSIDTDGVQTTFSAPDVAADARAPVMDLALPHLTGAWIEGTGPAAVIRIVRCEGASMAACDVRSLHVPGVPVTEPTAVSIANTGSEVIVAWEQAAGGVRLALIPLL